MSVKFDHICLQSSYKQFGGSRYIDSFLRKKIAALKEGSSFKKTIFQNKKTGAEMLRGNKAHVV
jgi:hypothetical protein